MNDARTQPLRFDVAKFVVVLPAYQPRNLLASKADRLAGIFPSTAGPQPNVGTRARSLLILPSPAVPDSLFVHEISPRTAFCVPFLRFSFASSYRRRTGSLRNRPASHAAHRAGQGVVHVPVQQGVPPRTGRRR